MRQDERLNHLGVEELLSLIDGELAPDRREPVARHLAECSRCRHELTVISRRSRQAAVMFDSGEAERPEAHHVARAELQAAMAGLSEELDRSVMARIRSRFENVGYPLTLAAAAAAIIVAVMWPGADRGGSVESGALPDGRLTPGATWTLSAEELCSAPRRVPAIPAAMREQVLRNYGMEQVPPDAYELDYLITPELGGATDARNLWPQRYQARRWNAYVKDQLEVLLPRLVCVGEIDLVSAQRDIAADWITAYRKYFRTSEPLGGHAAGDNEDVTRPEVLALSWPAASTRNGSRKNQTISCRRPAGGRECSG